MEKIYCVWMTNRKSRNSILIKAFRESEMALQEKKKQEALLKNEGKALEYNISCDCLEVY